MPPGALVLAPVALQTTGEKVYKRLVETAPPQGPEWAGTTSGLLNTCRTWLGAADYVRHGDFSTATLVKYVGAAKLA
jgi:hypothetical protein